MWDIVLKGGQVLDPYTGSHAAWDVAISNGRIAEIGDALSGEARQTIDAKGMFVCPAFLDIHTHCYPGATPLGVDAQKLGPKMGVLTWVDAGSSGAGNIGGFVDHVIERSDVRVYAFINVSFIGLTCVSHLTNHVGELYDLRLADIAQLARAIEKYRERILGIKIRAGNEALPVPGYEVPLRIARSVADSFHLPVMFHLGKAPPILEDIVPWVREGDIVTHVYTGHGGGPMGPQGEIKDAIREVKARGAVLDVGHGGGSFSFRVAERCMQNGLIADTISTDLHFFNLTGPVFDIATTMSKLLTLGLSLDYVINAVTKAASAAVKLTDHSQGLRAGAPANVVLIRVANGDYEFVDAEGAKLRGTKRIEIEGTIQEGRLVFLKQDGRS